MNLNLYLFCPMYFGLETWAMKPPEEQTFWWEPIYCRTLNLVAVCAGKLNENALNTYHLVYHKKRINHV